MASNEASQRVHERRYNLQCHEAKTEERGSWYSQLQTRLQRALYVVVHALFPFSSAVTRRRSFFCVVKWPQSDRPKISHFSFAILIAFVCPSIRLIVVLQFWCRLFVRLLLIFRQNCNEWVSSFAILIALFVRLSIFFRLLGRRELNGKNWVIRLIDASPVSAHPPHSSLLAF